VSLISLAEEKRREEKTRQEKRREEKRRCALEPRSHLITL